MMRVLMLSDVYFPRVNGVSTSIETFRAALAEQRVTVRLVAPDYAAASADEDIVRVAGRPVPGDPEDRLMSWRRLRAVVEREAEHCDLIHIQTPFLAHYAGLWAARRYAKPVLATYHTFFEEYLHHYAHWLPAPWLKGLARRLSRAQCNDLDAVIVPSTAMRERLLAYGVRAPLHILPTGIPTSRFAQGNGRRFRALHGIPAARPVALYVGRVAHEKNIELLLQAMLRAHRDLPELLLLITGEGPALPALKEQARRLGLGEAVRFLGYLDRQRELPDCYAAADVFAFASRTETQGLVLLEAMAAGLPVVALAAMGTRDILAAERGARVAADDPEHFAGRLLEVLADCAVAPGRLASEARAYAQEWADRRMAERLANLYRELCGQGFPYAEIARRQVGDMVSD